MSARPCREPITAAAIVERLRRAFPWPEWALFSEVRSGVGVSVEDVFRYVDAIAINTRQHSFQERVIGFEVKRSRADFLRELALPEKSEAIKRYCNRWYLVVAGRRSILPLGLGELPEGWGLIDVEDERDPVVVEAAQLDPEDLSTPFVLSLLRAARRERVELDEGPLRAVTRPDLGRGSSGLSCGHVVPRIKGVRTRCPSCSVGAPRDLDLLLAGIEDAEPEDLAPLREAFDRRAARPGLARTVAPMTARGRRIA